jgi:hypothetical protein
MPFQVQDRVRRQVLDSYIQRLKDLEEVAYGFTGVKMLMQFKLVENLELSLVKVSDDNASTLSLKFHKNSNRDDLSRSGESNSN